MQTLTILSCGWSERLERLLAAFPTLSDAARIDAADIDKHDLRDQLLLFTVAVDAYGKDAALCALIRYFRSHPDCLRGALLPAQNCERSRHGAEAAGYRIRNTDLRRRHAG